MSRQEWTEEHVNKLIELYPRAPYQDLRAAFPGRRPNSLIRKAYKLGLTRQVPSWLTKEQLTFSDFDLGFLIGFTEGEGCVGVHKQRRGTFEPYIYWANTSLELIHKLESLLKGKVRLWSQEQKPGQWKVVWKLGMRSRDDIRQLLVALEPCLISKRKHAQLLLELLDMEANATRLGSNVSGSKKIGLNRSRLEQIYQEVRALNARGA